MEKFERRAIKRQERRKWEETRDNLLFEYTQYSYYGRSSALTIFELAWKLSKDSIDMMWWSIVGATEQLILGKIESSAYTLECDKMQSHVSRLTAKSNDQNVNTAVKINFENDLHLALYRHWSAKESLKHSMFSACKLKLWTLRGEKRLHELLVEMGLPLVQARQAFSSMDLVLRKEFQGMIEKLAEKYDLADIIFSSFTLQYGYRNKYSASDYVYSMLATLESIKKDRSPEHCFLETLDSLTRNNKPLLENGIEMGKTLLMTIFKQVNKN
jgi:cell division control protein 45